MAKGDVTMRFDAQTAQFVSEIQKLQAKMLDLGNSAAKEGEKVVGVFDKMQGSFEKFSKADFGKELAQQLGIPTTPAEALGAAFRLAGEGLAFMNAEAIKGADALKKLEGAQKSLIQVSNDLAEFQSKRQQAREIAAKSGMSVDKAVELMTSVTNRGMKPEEAGFFAQTSAFTTQPEKMVDAVADIKSAFPKAGSSRDVLNKMLAGSVASKLNLENFAPAMTIAAPAMGMLGGTDSELAAMTASGAGFFGTGEKAGDRIQRGASMLNKMGLGGRGGMMESFKAFEALPEAEKKKAAGESMEFQGFLQFMRQKMPEILQTKSQIDRAGFESTGRGMNVEDNDMDLVGRRVRLAGSDPETAALMRRNRAAARREIAQGGAYGINRMETDSAIDEMNADAINRGEGGQQKFLRNKAAEAAQYVGGGEGAVKAAGEVGGFLGGNEAQRIIKVLEWIGFNTQSKGNADMIINDTRAGNE